MEFLSWLFFCLSPFALFCSESGNGMILCPAFIILGFIFKHAGSNSSGTPTAVVKINPQEFWGWHYKNRMRSTLAQKDSIGDELMAFKDKEARDWATTICGYHNAWVPPESEQERIARECGIITEKMLKARNENKDRMQVGKYVLMNELMEKYKTDYYLKSRIRMDIDKIMPSDSGFIGEYWAHKKYKKSIKEIWNSLSEEEKTQAARWVEEYEKQLMDMVREYSGGKYRDFNIEMDF